MPLRNSATGIRSWSLCMVAAVSVSRIIGVKPYLITPRLWRYAESVPWGTIIGVTIASRMMLEDGLAHGGVERRRRAADARIRTYVDDLDGHARIVDARLQFRDKFVGIDARKHAAIERRFTGGRDHVHLDWRSDAGRERRQ